MKRTFIIIILSVLLILLIPAISSYSTQISYKATEPGGSGDFDGIGRVVLGAVQAVGSTISVIVLVVIGIKYMLGSIDERAEYKKSMIPYIIGAVMFFAASNIGGILYDIAKKINV